MTAPEELQSYFRRWKNLEEEKQQIGDDLKELFAEAKGNGYDSKALRAAFRIKVKAEERTQDDDEFDAVVELYLDAIDSPARNPRLRIRENIEEFDPETGEIHDGNSEQHIRRSHDEQRDAARVSSSVGRREGDDEGNQGQGPGASGDDRGAGRIARTVDRQDEDGRSRHVGGEAHHEIAEPDGVAFAAVKAQGRLANTDGVEPPPSAGANASLTGVTVVGDERGTVIKSAGSSNGRTPEFDSGDAGSNPAPASTFKSKEFVLRPYCERPGSEDCGGVGEKHCYPCQKKIEGRAA